MFISKSLSTRLVPSGTSDKIGTGGNREKGSSCGHVVVPAEPNFDQTENKISASKEIKGPAEAVATAREPHDSPMPKEVRKEWTCDICQLTT
nr:hypothetical protein CFP56_27165 [Quercus suber]